MILYSDRTSLLSFIDNVWDFSTPQISLPSDAILNHSANGTQIGNALYVGLGPVVNVTFPFTVDLYNNASIADVTTTNGTHGNVTLPYDDPGSTTRSGSPAGEVTRGLLRLADLRLPEPLQSDTGPPRPGVPGERSVHHRTGSYRTMPSST